MKRIVIFGTGEGARRAWYQAADRVDTEVVAFADNDARKHGTLFFERPVWSARQLAKERSWDLVWLASQWHAEIRNGLVELGIPTERMVAVDFPVPETYETAADRMDRAWEAYLAALRQEDAAATAQPSRAELVAMFGAVASRLDDRVFVDAFLPPEEPRQWEEVRGAVRFLQESLAGLRSSGERIAVLAALAVLRPKNRAVLVVWSELLLALGDKQAAAEKARAALAIFCNDVPTQRLFLHCTDGADYFADAADRFCRQPFRNLEILDNGDCFICNCTWLPFPVGNAFRQTPAEIWRSPAAVALRRSILDGSFRYCSPMSCPMRFSLPKRRERVDAFRQIQMIGEGAGSVWPSEMALSYDRSCNLSCPSCRSELAMAGQAQRERMAEMRDRVVLPLLRTVGYVYITGSGDPFGSPHFRDLLRRLCDPAYRHVQLHLMTNGMLVTPRLWHEYAPLHRRISMLTVSIDGAQTETYERLRRGASWSRLEQTMMFLARERAQGRLRYLVVNMVVQEENFREMRLLIARCRQWNVDSLRFYRLRQWNSYTMSEYQARDIVNPLHPRHMELLEELGDPVFSDPIVYLWDLYDLIAQARRLRELGLATNEPS